MDEEPMEATAEDLLINIGVHHHHQQQQQHHHHQQHQDQHVGGGGCPPTRMLDEGVITGPRGQQHHQHQQGVVVEEEMTGGGTGTPVVVEFPDDKQQQQQQPPQQGVLMPSSHLQHPPHHQIHPLTSSHSHQQHPHCGRSPAENPRGGEETTTNNQSVIVINQQQQQNQTSTTTTINNTNNLTTTPLSPTTTNIQQQQQQSSDPNISQDSRKSTTNTSSTTGVPLLRPGNMVMMTITQEDYETQYLPQLMDAINQLLTITPGTYIPISYEQMYSCVYKCVCKQFSERLYTDLINHIRSHLSQIDSYLQECRNDSTVFVEKFSILMNQYLQALTGIVPIFNYMNRFYVETKLKTDLNDELRKLFSEIVVKQHISTLLTLLEEALSVPFTISPPVMASIIKNLYSLNPDYAQMKPDVFARYIPNIRPPTSIMGLEEYKAEARQMQQELLHNPEFNCSDTSRKRRSEEEIPRCGQPSH